MTRHPISSISFRLFLTSLLLCLLPILAAHAEPDTPTAAAGSISGRVTEVTTGAPLLNITVEIANLSGIPKTTTGADGRYRLTNVPDGAWAVDFFDPTGRYGYEYYEDAPIMALGKPITVKDGGEVTGIDAGLSLNGRITGRVTDVETGVPLRGVRAIARYLFYKTWNKQGEGVTDDEGRYVIEGLPTKVYHVEFVDELGDHATTQYEDGADVGVLVGEEVSGIDAALPHEGRIAGQVTDQLTGAPAAQVTVAVRPVDYFSETPVATVYTDEQGRYDAGGLALGAYWLYFAKDGYAGVYYGGATDAYHSTKVDVQVAKTTGGIDQSLSPLGGIAGGVTDAVTGAPLGGIDVIADEYLTTEMRTTSGPDGAYTFLGVAAGGHKVLLRDPKGAYRQAYAKGPDDSETITVQTGRTNESVNAALAPWAVSNRKITGTATDVVTGEPLGGIRVTMYDCWQSYHLECWDAGVVSTDAAGKYTFYDPGSAWGINFYDPNEIYLYQEAPNFRLPGPDETVVIDAALQRYDRVHGGISGKVTVAATGEPLAGQTVCGSSVEADQSGCARTGDDGTYRIDGLAIGPNRVLFGSGNWVGDRYGQQWYDGTVTVQPSAITPNVDGALPEQGRIEGTVRSSATGAPLPTATVEVCIPNFCDPVTTAADGTYVSRYLPPATYQLHATKAGYQQRYYRDTRAWGLAEPVTVTYASLITGIDMSLPELGRLIGQVTDATTGAPVAGITVNGQATYWYSAKTDAEGRYLLANLEEGAYRLSFKDDQERYAPWTSTQPVTVTLGQTAEFDAQLVGNGYIAGRVTAAESGQPLGGIETRAGSLMLWTGPDGTYKIGPLPDGDYEVRFYDPGLLRRTDYRKRVPAKHGETTVDIDDAMVLLARARGRVIDADTGAPVVGVRLQGQGAWGIYNPVYTEAEGRYDVPGLADGRYSLDVVDRSHVYIDGQSEAVTIQAGTIIDIPDVRLKKWGEFGGTVTDAVTGQPVAGVWVELYAMDPFVYSVYPGYAITGPDGTYRIRGMSNGTVKPVFSDPQARYHAQSYGGGRSLLDGQTVTFTRGTDTLGIDAALVRKGDGPPVEPGQRVWLPVVMGE